MSLGVFGRARVGATGDHAGPRGACVATFSFWALQGCTERTSLEKKPSTRLSQEPCLGVKMNSKRPAGWSASQALVSSEMCAE
jgi:hypothetical protein